MASAKGKNENFLFPFLCVFGEERSWGAGVSGERESVCVEKEGGESGGP